MAPTLAIPTSTPTASPTAVPTYAHSITSTVWIVGAASGGFTAGARLSFQRTIASGLGTTAKASDVVITGTQVSLFIAHMSIYGNNH